MARRFRALGAIAGQFSQAFGSFLLQVLALRLMGVEGLAQYALLFGFVIIATALVTGLVGDSLTVLDRSEPTVRAGLRSWMLATTAAVALVPAAVAWIADLLPLGQSVLFALSTYVFVIVEILRRLLMACLRFWSLVIVDVASLITSVGVVLGADLLAGEVTLGTFLLALSLGQSVAIAAGVVRLPADERWLALGARRDYASVWRYGSWRAMQQVLRPAMLAGVRAIATITAGLAAYGELEVARVYVAPAMLTVAGVASYLFASYARDRTSPLAFVRRRADRAVMGLGLATVTLAVIATLLVPSLEGLLSSERDVSRIGVFGWAMYAASVAAVTPYGALAAVRGRQVAVFIVRALESVACVAAVGIVIAAGATIFVAPLVITAVSLVSGAVMRLGLLSDRAAPSLEHAPS